MRHSQWRSWSCEDFRWHEVFLYSHAGKHVREGSGGCRKFVDDRAKQLANGLDEYGSAIRSAKQGYNTTDHSVSLDFKAVDKTLSEIA